MKALIFEDKIVEVSAESFPVHNSMEWVDCPTDCKAGEDWNYEKGVCVPISNEVKKERLIKENREHRNALLKESDILMLPDYPKGGTQEIKDYRQALRDWPENNTTIAKLENQVWPKL